MEQPQRGVHEHYSMFIRRFDTLLIHDTSARSGQIFHTTLPRSVHVIREGEESIARTCGLIQLLPPVLPLFLAQRLGDTFKKTLPVRLLRSLENLTADVEVNGVRLVRALDAFFEGKRKDLWVMPEPPKVGLGPRQTGAVDTRLLSGPDPDDRSTVCIGDAVGLGILEGECGNDQVPHGVIRELKL